MILQLFLLSLVVRYFAVPNFQKYFAQKILVTTREEAEAHLTIPAVTICPSNPAVGTGYKKNVSISDNFIEELCFNANNISSCLEDESYNLTQGLIGSLKGFAEDAVSFASPEDWVGDISFMIFGRCYTLSSNMTMELRFTTGAIRFQFKQGLNYNVFIHDRNYFIVNVNPFALPKNYISIEEEFGRQYYKLHVVQRHNLATSKHACNSDPSYKFSTCVRETFSSKVGCRLPWDRLTRGSVVVCDTREQYRSTITLLDLVY